MSFVCSRSSAMLDKRNWLSKATWWHWVNHFVRCRRCCCFFFFFLILVWCLALHGERARKSALGQYCIITAGRAASHTPLHFLWIDDRSGKTTWKFKKKNGKPNDIYKRHVKFQSSHKFKLNSWFLANLLGRPAISLTHNKSATTTAAEATTASPTNSRSTKRNIRREVGRHDCFVICTR